MPFLLNATIRKHDQPYQKIDEEFARIVRNKFHVDGLNCGVNMLKKALIYILKNEVLIRQSKFCY